MIDNKYQGNNVFWTQQSRYIYKVTVVVTAHTKPVQVEPEKTPRKERGGGLSCLAEKLLLVD